MKRSAFGGWSLAVFAVTMTASPVLAAQGGPGRERQPSRASVAEVTPFISMGSPTSSRVGSAIAFPVTSSLSVETELGYRRGEGDVNALSTSVGVLYSLPHVGRVVPYVAAGIGLAEHGTPLVLPGRTDILTQSQLAITVNAGGGLKVPVDDKWGLRSDARWFKSIGGNGSDHWRLYQGASVGVGKR